MTRTLVTMFLAALCVGAGGSCLVAADDEVQFDDGYPPAVYIATAEPVYFEGHATYWYGNRWYYQDGGAWRSYRAEPARLRESRARHEPARQFYGRAHGGGFRRR